MISRVNELSKIVKRETKRLKQTTCEAEFDIPVEIFDPGWVADVPPFSATEVHSEPSGFKLYVGGVSDAMYKNHLLSYGISAVLNCAAAQTANARSIIVASGNSLDGSGWEKIEFSQDWYARELSIPDFKYLAISAEDHSSFPLSEYFTETSTFIEDARIAGVPILVHCMQGLNRSAAIVVAWLVLHGKHTLETAITCVSSRRAFVLSNKGFIRQLVSVFEGPPAVAKISHADDLMRDKSSFEVKDIVER
jgi:Dual specificity phosphatase, catalytic domain